MNVTIRLDYRARLGAVRDLGRQRGWTVHDADGAAAFGARRADPPFQGFASRVEHTASRLPVEEHLCHPWTVSVERRSGGRGQLAGRASPVVQLDPAIQGRCHSNDSVRPNQQACLPQGIL